MEWLSQLQGQVIGLDTAPIIYLIEHFETIAFGEGRTIAVWNMGIRSLLGM